MHAAGKAPGAGLDSRALQRVLGQRSGCRFLRSSDDCDVGASGRPIAGLRLLRYDAQELLRADRASNAAERGQGIGTALLLATLHAMRDAGYMYAIIGGAGPVGYYEKVGATVIPDTEPSRAYLGMLGTEAVYADGAPSDSFLGMESINQNGDAA